MLLPVEKTHGLNPAFLETLNKIAARLPFDLIINEGVPPTTEGSHVKDSEHFSGLGVDVSAQNGYNRYLIVTAALKEGIDRLGVYDHHVHLGASRDLPHPVMWGGKSA